MYILYVCSVRDVDLFCVYWIISSPFKILGCFFVHVVVARRLNCVWSWVFRKTVFVYYGVFCLFLQGLYFLLHEIYDVCWSFWFHYYSFFCEHYVLIFDFFWLRCWRYSDLTCNMIVSVRWMKVQDVCYCDCVIMDGFCLMIIHFFYDYIWFSGDNALTIL